MKIGAKEWAFVLFLVFLFKITFADSGTEETVLPNTPIPSQITFSR
jgi:hypothetical protein